MNIQEILHQKYCELYAILTSTGGNYVAPAIPRPEVSLGVTPIQQHKISDSSNSMLPIGNSHQIGVSISFLSKSATNEWCDMNPIIVMEVKSSRSRAGSSRKWVHPSNFGGPLNRPINGNYGCGTPVNGLQTEWSFPVLVPSKTYDIYIRPMRFYRNEVGSQISFPLKKTDAISLGLISKFIKSKFSVEDEQSSSYWRNIIRFRFVIFDTINGKLTPFFGEPSNEIILEPKIGTFSDEDSWLYDFSVRIK